MKPPYSANQPAEAVVEVYDGERVIEVVTRERSRELKASGKYYFFNHGKALQRANRRQEMHDERNHVAAGTVREAWPTVRRSRIPHDLGKSLGISGKFLLITTRQQLSQ